MAALLLADFVVTLLPNEGSTSVQAQQAATDSPKFSELMHRWNWLAPLWRLGIVRAGVDGRTPRPDVEQAARALTDDDHNAALRPLMRPALLDDPRLLLDSLSRDLLRGGPDPAIAIPVSAGLDRFTADEGLLAARPEPTSVAQRAEMRLAQVHGRFSAPILTQAPAERIIELRQSLDEELHHLREMLDAAAEMVTEQDVDFRPIKRASGALAHAFEQIADDITRPDEDGVSVKAQHCTFTLVSLPSDAVVRSSLTAARASGMSGRRAAPEPVKHVGRLIALVVKPLGDAR